MSNKPYIGDTPEQLNCKLAHIDSALLVDGFVYTKDAVRQLKAERDALSAQVEVLKDAANFAYCNWRSSSDVLGGMRILVDAVDSTPQQALAEIRAEAGRAGFIAGSYLWCDYHTGSEHKDDLIDDIKSDADQYAEQIRQGGVK